ncbi:MAG: hypothetical protein A2287_04250 [Candidatus Melainabacteria bacterium RIFOXYA12_FULL_32_12]|nr:MAG: hypothetical protein A2255_08185 [Candidatus Melainabacteria bacterium RIFOXYA2_FULL_32_9]OGI30615.1 MAG: hypothetical protein A2287_04250 [Candidatus Melainabacteria bacterium RIFOXYA12_FULL_32_12]
MKNYYDILEIHPDSSHEVIEATYKALCKHYNPQNFSDRENKLQAKRRTNQIKEAYKVLSDSRKRAKYDKYYKEKDGHVEIRKSPIETVLVFLALAVLMVIIGKYIGDIFFKYFAKLTVIIGNSPILSIILLFIIVGIAIHFFWKNFKKNR